MHGYQLEFNSFPVQFAVRETKFNKNEGEIMDIELQKLIDKGVIEETEHSEGEYISTVFLRPKKDGKYRLILNLKQLNEHIEYCHFKMERLWHST